MRLRKLTDGKQFYICVVKLENSLTCNAIVIFKNKFSRTESYLANDCFYIERWFMVTPFKIFLARQINSQM